jgi:ferredoxin
LLELVRGALDPKALTGKPFKEVMDSCFNCKLCLSECPSQVDIPGLAIAARKEFVEAHGMPLRNWVLGKAADVAKIASIAPGLGQSPHRELGGALGAGEGGEDRGAFGSATLPAVVRDRGCCVEEGAVVAIIAGGAGAWWWGRRSC